MNLFIFIFSTLSFEICLYYRFIPMLTNCIYIKSFSPKLASPKLFLYFWMKSEYFLCCNALYYLNYFHWTIHRDTLYPKMNILNSPNSLSINTKRGKILQKASAYSLRNVQMVRAEGTCSLLLPVCERSVYRNDNCKNRVS